MSNENNNMNSVVAAAIIGFSLITCVCLLGKSYKDASQFEFKQEGPIFIRFNKAAGDLCYTGIGPNGKFITDAWICLEGNKIKSSSEAGDILPAKGDKKSSKSSKKSSDSSEE